VLVGFESQLAPMMAVRKDVLIELRDLEWLREVGGVARLNCLYQMPERAVECVHRALHRCLARGRHGRAASSAFFARSSCAALSLAAPNLLSVRTAILSLPVLPSPNPCQ